MITRTSRGTKRFAIAAAAAVAGSTLALTGTAVAGPGADAPTAERLSGDDRYATAAAVAGELDADTANGNAVVIVNGLDFPDGLSATSLVNGVGPVEVILLTEAGGLPQATIDALAALDDENGDGTGTDGISAIVVVGGETVVSSAVFEDLAEYAATSRIEGANRYETAIAVAEVAGGTAATITTGMNFPDALAAGPLASVADAPLLLNDGDALRTDVREYLVDNSVTDVYIVGGEAVVPASVETELTGALGITVTRLAGDNRSETAVAIADELEVVSAGFNEGVTAVNGMGFADALAAGPLAVFNEDAILLVNDSSIPAATATYHVDNCTTIEDIFAIGGTSVISDDVVTGAVGAATCETPVLESATIATADLTQRTILVGEGTVTTAGPERVDGAPTLTAVVGSAADGTGANPWGITFVADADPANQGAEVDAVLQTIEYTDNFASLTRGAFVTNWNASDAGALFVADASTGAEDFDAVPDAVVADTTVDVEVLGTVDITVTITFTNNVDDGAGNTLAATDVFANQNPGDATVSLDAADATVTPDPIPADGTNVFVQTYTDYEGELPSAFAQVRYAIGDVHDAANGLDNQAILTANLVAA
ncbi:MAG: cell wall-binding repeat-containing protein [Ilumatobacter sp.]